MEQQIEQRKSTKCPKCGGELVKENDHIECDNSKCDYGVIEKRKEPHDYGDWVY